MSTFDDWATSNLSIIWQQEWTDLSPALQELVVADYLAASEQDRRDYRHNIRTGNLAKYAECLAVQS